MFDDQEFDDDTEYTYLVKARPQVMRSKADRRLRLTHSQMRAEIEERETRAGTAPVARSAFTPEQVLSTLIEQDPNRQNFNPTLGSVLGHKNHMSNHEREWILTYLGGFYDDHLISDVLRRVKAGKEATVYCCRADPQTGLDLAAGKVYHERMFRGLQNDSLYREGRAVLDDRGKGVRGRREALAMAKKSRFGQDLRQVSWLSSEYTAMQTLFEAGADVPKPLAKSNNAILMEYIGAAEWPAPPLIQVTLERQEALPVFKRLVENIELMLSLELVHGDLSAHNILFWEGRACIIDFPQAVSPFVNNSAYEIFERDVLRVCQYFHRYGIQSDPKRLALDLWQKYVPS